MFPLLRQGMRAKATIRDSLNLSFGSALNRSPHPPTPFPQRGAGEQSAAQRGEVEQNKRKIEFADTL